MGAVAGALGFVSLWPLYGELYRHGGDKAIEVMDSTSLAHGYRPEKPQTLVFADDEELSDHLSRAIGATGIASIPASRWVIVATGARSSTGYELRLVRSTEERGRIVVFVRERTPSVRDRVEPRVTYPFLLLSLPLGEKPVRVELEGRP